MLKLSTAQAYHVLPYFGAKLVAELPVGAVFPLLFGAVVYPLTGLNPRPSRCDRVCEAPFFSDSTKSTCHLSRKLPRTTSLGVMLHLGVDVEEVGWIDPAC